MDAPWLDQLKRDYARELPAKLDAVRRLAAGAADPAVRAQLIDALHKLGGSAGSFGCARVSQAAQSWERALRAGSAETGLLAALELAVELDLASLPGA